MAEPTTPPPKKPADKKHAAAPAHPAHALTSPFTTNADDELVLAFKNFESFRGVSYEDGKLNLDGSKEKSIGYGHHLRPGEVIKPMPLDEARATELLKSDIASHQGIVEDWAAKHHVSLNANEKAALTDLVFNMGPKPLYGTIGADLKAGDKAGAAEAIMAWDKMRDKDNNLVTSTYLEQRRIMDKALFEGNWEKVNTQIVWADHHNNKAANWHLTLHAPATPAAPTASKSSPEKS